MKKKTNFREYDQNQGLFTQIVPAELLEEEHPARVIDAVVEKLDLSRIFAAYSDEGKPAYHPRMMFKVLFYSYYCGILTSRKMSAALLSGRADFIFLSGNQVPDFRTLNEFRSRHIDELPNLFAQIVLICESLDMIGFEHLALDGQKIQANANFRQSMNRERLEKRLKKIEEGMKKILESPISESLPKETKRSRLADLQSKKEKLSDFMAELARIQGEKNEDVAVNMTDPDAPIMSHKDGRTLPSYNHQSAVDSLFGITCAVKTTDKPDQQSDTLSLTDEAEKNAGRNLFRNVTADCAFGGMDFCETLANEKRLENFLVPDKRYEAWKKGKRGPYDSGCFLRGEQALLCPAGEFLEFAGRVGERGLKYVGSCCGECDYQEECAAGKVRNVTIDEREGHLISMRLKLNSEEGREIYRSRQGIVENGHGHDQKNLGWRQHGLSGLLKAGAEFMLMRIGANLGKIARYRSMEALAL